eukprot:1146847-Pelagomonas_calceolata.AAC.3
MSWKINWVRDSRPGSSVTLAVAIRRLRDVFLGYIEFRKYIRFQCNAVENIASKAAAVVVRRQGPPGGRALEKWTNELGGWARVCVPLAALSDALTGKATVRVERTRENARALAHEWELTDVQTFGIGLANLFTAGKLEGKGGGGKGGEGKRRNERKGTRWEGKARHGKTRRGKTRQDMGRT